LHAFKALNHFIADGIDKTQTHPEQSAGTFTTHDLNAKAKVTLPQIFQTQTHQSLALFQKTMKARDIIGTDLTRCAKSVGQIQKALVQLIEFIDGNILITGGEQNGIQEKSRATLQREAADILRAFRTIPLP
jgi:hypothetical protein